MIRGALVLLVLIGTGILVRATWPSPDAEIRVLPGGVAQLHDVDGARALPDTVVVTRRGWRFGDRRRITVTNTDSTDHTLAMFHVKAGETRVYEVPPGMFGGACTAHPDNGTLFLHIR